MAAPGAVTSTTSGGAGKQLATVSLVQLLSTEFNCKYWFSDAYHAEIKQNTVESKASKGESERENTRRRVAAGESTKWVYLEDQDGALLSVPYAEQMRSFAQSIFEEMLLVLGNDCPAKWSTSAPASWRQHFETMMETKFKELRYCEAHWKAHQLAIHVYAMWQSARAKSALREHVKKEEAADPLQPNDPSASSTIALGKRRMPDPAGSAEAGPPVQMKKMKRTPRRSAATL